MEMFWQMLCNEELHKLSSIFSMVECPSPKCEYMLNMLVCIS